MSWITVDTKLDDHPKMAALPSDMARWGWIVTLCKAKEQRTPGTFASEKHYRYVMGRHGRFLEDYLAAKLMDKGEDGTLHVHDWRKHQWAGAKAQQRETSEGHSGDNEETFLGQKEDRSRAVPVHVPVSSSNGTEKTEDARAPDPADVYWTLTGRYPTDKVLGWVDDLSASYGPEAVTRALATTHQADRSTQTLLGRTQDVLRAEARALSLKEQTTVRQDLKDRRAAAPVRDEEAIRAEVRRLLEPGAAA